ncbi:MAG: VOC family protein [Proteobacteria bacterium]|nr:VOC family protein [Pseudomonadota bacterium]
MIDHLSTYAIDFAATKNFYVATLAELGYSLQTEMTFDADPDFPGRRACVFGPAGRSVFWVVEVRESSSPRHIAFAAESREAVAEFHLAGLTAGGEDFGAPGLRPNYHENYFGAFLTDPDGNNVEAVCHRLKS